MLLGTFARKVLPARPGTALLVNGGPGIGKTEVVMDHFRGASDWAVAKMVAAQETPESVAGFLWIDKDSGSCSYKAQRRLVALNEAMEQGKKAVLVIDEFRGGDRMTHNALQQLVREHEVGDWVAKGYLYVICLTNRSEDRANVVRLTAPMINRFQQVDVEADFEFWREWASGSGMKQHSLGKNHPRIHPDILGFLSAIMVGGEGLRSEKAKEWARDKSLLFCSPAPNNEEAFPTPRSYEIASDNLYLFGNNDEDFLREMLSGCIGVGAAFEFCAWLKVGRQAADIVNDILNGKSVGALDVGMQFFVNASITAMYAKDTNKTAEAITKYLAELDSEYALLLINDLSKISDKITKNSGWMKVVQKHKKVAIAGKK